MKTKSGTAGASTPAQIPHVMITASAGSGKTWKLTNRILTLILAGAAPESIIALTFTRKAAGEFFDAVLGRLAGAAGDATRAAELCHELGLEPRPPEAFLPPLRALVARLHRLQFTTIDSFFHRIVAAFPFELGLSGAFRLMEGYAAGQARIQVLEQILRRADGPGAAGARRQFLEHFKQATHGTEAKSPAAGLEQYVRELHLVYQEIPDPDCWGGGTMPQSLRPTPAPAFPTGHEEALRSALARCGAKDAGLEAWDQWGRALLDWQPTCTITESEFNTIHKNILTHYDPQTRTCGEFNLKRGKIKPDAALARDLGAVVEAWWSRELHHRLEMTRGVGRILEGYEENYDRMVRRTGRLVFSDLPGVIGPVFRSGARLDLDYRLDARFDHWLLDEFQDTSRVQWQVLENLIDEVVQDAEGRRSFFCVGDVKQSIYAWRGGDHRLFGEMAGRYGPHIQQENLAVTYRCSGAVVDLVNRVMGSVGTPGVLPELPGAAAWASVWQEHRSKRPGTGCAVYLEAPEKDEDDTLEPRHWVVARLVREINAPARSLTCAVLTYSNDEARAIADHLRTVTPHPVILEGEIHPAGDNMLGRLALAWLLALAHPADTLAEGWLRSSPVGERFRTGAEDTENWRVAAWRAVHGKGFEAVLEELFAEVAERNPLDEFHRLRRRQILDAVRAFETDGTRDPAALAAYLETHALKAPDMPGSIQVMTIHKAKGLGFDVVVVTELARRSHPMNKERKGPLIHRGADRKADWLLFPPTSAFRPLSTEIRNLAEEAVEQNAYEQCCLLYVALTRARQALYLVGDGKISEARSIYPQHLLRAALTEGRDPVPLLDDIEALSVFGQPDWYGGIPERHAEPAAAPSWSFSFPETEPVSVPDPSPSHADSQSDGVVSRAQRTARRSGTRIHALFAALGEGDGLQQILSTPESLDEASAEVRACLGEPAIRALFTPGPHDRVWCERAFQVESKGRWIRGVFDRVILHGDTQGRTERATLVDFKTDASGHSHMDGPDRELVERHHAQMEAYREALSVLTGLSPSQITGILVSVPSRRAIPVWEGQSR